MLQYLQDEYVPTQASEYLKQFYVLIDGTNYDFYVEVKTPFFNTRIKDRNRGMYPTARFFYFMKTLKLGLKFDIIQIGGKKWIKLKDI